MTIPGNTYRVPLTAAALAILLAACGSGNGHDGSNADTKALSDTTTAATAKHATKADAAQAGDPAQANAAAQAGDAAPATDASGTISSATAANRTAVADTAEASTVTQAAPQAAPISAAGVRGDALLTMLDQKGCLTLDQATSYNGTRVTTGQPLELPEPRADTDLNPNNYQKTTPNSPGLLSPFAALGNIICDTQYYQYHATAPGEYSLSVGSGPHPRHQYLGEKILREFTGQRISASLTVTADSASLADAVSVGAGKPSIGGVGAPFSFRLDGVASYGLLKQWGSQVGNLAKLLLLKGDSDQQAKLCWNIEQPRARRLQCVVWQAPANWKRGQQLQVVDQYLVDDRSVYGEKGFVYWRGRFPQ